MGVYDLSLIIEHADGTTTRWGPDELNVSDVPTGLRFGTSMPGGYRDLVCALMRRIDLERADENTFDTVTVYGPGNRIVWQGRWKQFPRRHGDSYVVEPGAEGWVAHLRDNKAFREIYRDVDLARWGDGPSVQRRLDATAAGYDPVGQISTDRNDSGNPVLRQTIVSPWTRLPLVEAYYDARGIEIGSVAYAWQTGTNVSADDANWYWEIYTSSTDTLAAISKTGDLQPSGSTGSGSLTSVAGRYFAMAQFFYGLAYTGDSGVDRSLYWSQLAVYGRHGLTKRGTEPNAGFYLSDLLEDVVSRGAPLLNTDDIDENTVTIPHLVYLDPTPPLEIVERLNGFALWHWGVYDDKRFFFRAPDDSAPWQLRLDQGARLNLDGPTGDDIISGVVVQYTDPSGRSKTVGPTGSGAATEDSSLSTTDADNPAVAHGIDAIDVLRLSDIVDDDTAVLIGQLYLAERSVPQRRGEAEVTGLAATHPTMGPRPAFEIRAGDFVQFVDTNDDSLGSPRLVVETDYDHDTRTNRLTLDNTARRTEALLSILNAELVGVGL